MAQERLAGRVAIVTGAAQGLGAAFAKAMAAEGARVCVSDVLDAKPVVEEIVKSGGQAIAAYCDVTDPKSVQAMVATTVKTFGSLEVLVNNAGLFTQLKMRPLFEIDSAEWDKVMAVNVRGGFECVKAAAPEMKKRKYGKIINLSSGTVFKGAPNLLHYVTSKGAILAMTRCMARELGDDGIRVNALAPGLTMSAGVKENAGWIATLAGNIASRAIKREAAPEDLLGTLVYLASADSDFVTGQCIVCDGGSVMH
ncbi:MAG: glucose 1-dehydrogenase [Betaproteobacteria bacterium]|nr:glucose 1-dehydrogenase [Betaproteobacteria bacterium]